MNGKELVCTAACTVGFVASSASLIVLEILFAAEFAKGRTLVLAAVWTLFLCAVAWTSILAFIVAPIAQRVANVLGRATPGSALVILPYAALSLAVMAAQLFVQHPFASKLLWAAQVILATVAVLALVFIPVAVAHSLPRLSPIEPQDKPPEIPEK